MMTTTPILALSSKCPNAPSSHITVSQQIRWESAFHDGTTPPSDGIAPMLGRMLTIARSWTVEQAVFLDEHLVEQHGRSFIFRRERDPSNERTFCMTGTRTSWAAGIMEEATTCRLFFARSAISCVLSYHRHQWNGPHMACADWKVAIFGRLVNCACKTNTKQPSFRCSAEYSQH